MALHLPINEQCNIQCVFCSAAGRGGAFELPYLLSQVDADKTGHVQISGGDPLLKEPAELLELLVHCRKRKKIVEFQTNAVLVPRYDKKRLRLIAGLVDFFNVNFSAHTPELDYEVTRTKGAFEARVEAVRMLLELGSTVRLNYIVHRANCAHAEDFVGFAAREMPGFSWIQFSYVKGMGRAKGDAGVMPRFREAAPALNAAMARCKALGIGFDVDHIPVCFVMDYKDHHVDYRKMRAGRSGVHISEKQKVAECDGCNLREVCPGPRRDYIELYGAL
ncbi:MAG TPA: radical SAM protein [Elusimicrobiota bacterium]|jgi:MoaA/NifB/PqqE/SkfB family radical SAM enzyme|nr:radical SAM protein [Elusimicrobiota bacterium]